MKLQLSLVACSLLLGAASGALAGKMIFTDRGASIVRIANLDGSDLQSLIPSAGSNIRGIAIDVANDELFYADNGSDTIYRARLDGSGRVAIVATDLGFPADLALDRESGKLYWCDRNNNRIERSDYDGSGRETVLTTTQPYYLDLDLVHGKLYWGDFSGGNIFRADLADGTGEETMVTGLIQTRGVKVDPAGGYLYWCDREAHKVQRRRISGGEIEDLYTGLDTPHGMTLDIPAGKVYWVDTGTNKLGGTGARAVSRGDMDGSGPQEVLADVTQPWDITLDMRVSDYSQWIARRFPKDAAGAVTDRQADPDGDGLANLVEYFAHLDPFASQPIPPTSLRIEEGEALFSYRRSAQPITDLVAGIQVSSDLRTWVAAPTNPVGATGTGDGASLIQVRLDPAAVAPSGTFLRLEPVPANP